MYKGLIWVWSPYMGPLPPLLSGGGRCVGVEWDGLVKRGEGVPAIPGAHRRRGGE